MAQWQARGETGDALVTSDDWFGKPLAAGMLAALLTAVSLWGWARNRCVFLLLIALGVASGALVMGVITVGSSGAGSLWLALAPPLVWAVSLGAVISRVPVRLHGYGENAFP